MPEVFITPSTLQYDFCVHVVHSKLVGNIFLFTKDWYLCLGPIENWL